ncbi:hypothetical protein CO659_12775 [Rhizobium sp. S9]|nr:hypothetical protein CO659_12775 [Rhizobium sp. S9]
MRSQGVETLMDALFGGPVAANDNKPRVRDHAGEKERRLARAPERVCEFCGITFKKIKKDKLPPRFCSKTCSGTSGMAALLVLRPSKPASFIVHKLFCDVCGDRFTTKNAQNKRCSDFCRLKADRIKALASSVANDNVDRSIRPCAECSNAFSPLYGEKRSIYCSKSCAKRNGNRRRRKKEKARLRGVLVETVDPIKVFERDKWKCQICGVKTPRKLRGTYEDRAPELDHIMPLSLGGAHSYMNTQCACRKCNAAKSDTPPNQASLFAFAA